LDDTARYWGNIVSNSGSHFGVLLLPIIQKKSCVYKNNGNLKIKTGISKVLIIDIGAYLSLPIFKKKEETKIGIRLIPYIINGATRNKRVLVPNDSINKFYPECYGNHSELVILLLVQVGIVIIHRKNHYGILLSKGVSWAQMRGMVLMQITLSFAVAMGFAIFIDEGMQWFLVLCQCSFDGCRSPRFILEKAQTKVWTPRGTRQNKVDRVLAGQLENVTTIKPYIDHIIAGQLDLLPLSFLDYMLVGGTVLLVLCLITIGLLKRMILLRYMEPAYLF